MTETHSTPPDTPREDRYDDAEAVLTELIRLIRLMKRASNRFAGQRGDGIEHAAYVLLAVLCTDGPQRTTALAEAVHSDTSTVSRQVGALVREGFVERQADPADGRACLLAATDRGEQCFAEQRRNRTVTLSRMLGHWPVEELRRAAHLLDRLNTDFEREEQQLQQPAMTASREGGIQ